VSTPITRRTFSAGVLSAAAAIPTPHQKEKPQITDIHQHTHYAGRPDDVLIRHQRTLGVTRTILLPAGSKLGLDADCYGNDSVLELAKRYPGEFAFFANEVPDIPEAKSVIEKYLNLGACGIGEQKFPVECDSAAMHLMAQIARHYRVPVLMHIQHNRYNTGFLRFHKMLEKYPDVNFIGHAQTWWGNIDRYHVQEQLYPRGQAFRDGYTDRLLADYPNMFGDLSAGSGLNALLRDEEYAAAFLQRHHQKLMYGSDCDDHIGQGVKCSGWECLHTLRRLLTNRDALQNILYRNAARVIPARRAV
jgi:predicted TIM-barrel fold metal-dependent hydrolase